MSITISFTGETLADLQARIAEFQGTATSAPSPEAEAPKATRGRGSRAAKTAATTPADTAPAETANVTSTPAKDAAPALDYEKDVKPHFVKLAALPEGKPEVAKIIAHYKVKSAMDIPAEKFEELVEKLSTAHAKLSAEPAADDTPEF